VRRDSHPGAASVCTATLPPSEQHLATGRQQHPVARTGYGCGGLTRGAAPPDLTRAGTPAAAAAGGGWTAGAATRGGPGARGPPGSGVLGCSFVCCFHVCHVACGPGRATARVWPRGQPPPAPAHVLRARPSPCRRPTLGDVQYCNNPMPTVDCIRTLTAGAASGAWGSGLVCARRCLSRSQCDAPAPLFVSAPVVVVVDGPAHGVPSAVPHMRAIRESQREHG
jgi:hypothetical protein